MKLYRYLKKVWSDRQIITHTDMNRIEEGIEAFGNNVSKATVPDIETLKGLKYLAVGDIVQLNGYYQAGDGAHHKRKIESADDGSGVQLANGLWANIVHNGEVNVSWFGAKGDGVTDDTGFLEKAISTNNEVLIDKNLKITRTIVLPSNSVIKGMNDRTFAFTGTKSSISIFRNEFTGDCVFDTPATQGQDITMKDLVFSGYANISYSDLSTAEDIGISCINVRGVKQGLTLTGNVCKKMGSFLSQNRKVGYNGTTIFKNNTISATYRCFDYDNTTGFNVEDCNFYDCYTVGSSRSITFINTTFNNSSFASETSQIVSDDINLINSYVEGYNQVFKTNKLYALGCYFSETFSQSGATKFLCSQKTGIINYEFIDCRIPTNTRLVFIDDMSKMKDSSVIMKGCIEDGTVFSQVAEDVWKFVKEGMEYVREDFNFYKKRGTCIGESIIPKLIYPITKITFAKNRNFLAGYSKTTTDFVELLAVGTQDGAGDSNPKSSNIIISVSNVLTSDITNSNASNFAVEIIKNNSTELEIKLQVKHAGNKVRDLVYIKNLSANLNFVSIEETTGDIVSNVNVAYLDTPYHATKMQEEGVYNDFIQYMDEKTEYDRLQRELDQQRQLAFEQRENQEKVYEEWLAEQPMQMSIDVEPVPSEKLLEFKKKYLG